MKRIIFIIFYMCVPLITSQLTAQIKKQTLDSFISATVNGVNIANKPSIMFVPSDSLRLKIAPADTIVKLGDFLILNILIENVNDLGSFQFDLHYLSKKIQADTAWLGPFLKSTGRMVAPVGPIIENTSDTGKVTFGGFSFGSAPGPEGNGILASIRFTSGDTGQTMVTLANVQVTDTKGNILTVSHLDTGYVTISPSDLPVDPVKTTVTAHPTQILADGISCSKITVTPLDSQGNKIGPGQFVSLTTTNGLLLEQVLDCGDGTYTQELQSSTIPGVALVGASVNRIKMSQQARVTFSPTNGIKMLIAPEDTSIVVGTTVNINVNISNTENLGSFQFDIRYLSGIIQANTAWLGNFLGSSGRNVSLVGPDIDNASDTGHVTIGGFSFGGNNGPDGAGTLATIQFTVKNPGNTPLILKDVQITDINGQPQPISFLGEGALHAINPFACTINSGSCALENNVFANYPNPFNLSTTISFHLIQSEWITLKIFNLLGQEVLTLLDQRMEAGIHHICWYGRDKMNQDIPSGIYLLLFKTESYRKIRKLILQK